MAKPSFIAIPSKVLQDESLSIADKLVYGAMLAYQGKWYHCFAAYEKIAKRLGVNRHTVARSVSSLSSAGMIEAVEVENAKGETIQFTQKGGKKHGRTKAWRCLVPLPRKANAEPNESGIHLVAKPRTVA